MLMPWQGLGSIVDPLEEKQIAQLKILHSGDQINHYYLPFSFDSFRELVRKRVVSIKN